MRRFIRVDQVGGLHSGCLDTCLDSDAFRYVLTNYKDMNVSKHLFSCLREELQSVCHKTKDQFGSEDEAIGLRLGGRCSGETNAQLSQRQNVQTRRMDSDCQLHSGAMLEKSGLPEVGKRYRQVSQGHIDCGAWRGIQLCASLRTRQLLLLGVLQMSCRPDSQPSSWLKAQFATRSTRSKRLSATRSNCWSQPQRGQDVTLLVHVTYSYS